MARLALPAPTLPKRVPAAGSPVPSDPGGKKGLSAVALRLGIVLIAGGFHGLGWVFPGAWYSVWIGHTAFVTLGVLCRPRAAFAYGTLAGAIGIGAAFHWGIDALKLTIDAPTPVAWTIFTILVAIEGISLGVFSLTVSLVSRLGLRRMWLVPLAW